MPPYVLDESKNLVSLPVCHGNAGGLSKHRARMSKMDAFILAFVSAEKFEHFKCSNLVKRGR